ncbi:MAG: HAD family hydrolase [Methanoregula sp.]|nr:HAD family hydrolase [Methanoregula sp.]
MNLLLRMKNARTPVTTILFDMDNTLFDLFGAQVAACRSVVQQFGREDGEELFSYFLTSGHGYESHDNIRQYMNDRGIPLDGVFRKACLVYETKKLQHIIPYEEVTETLQVLHANGYTMGIVTDAHSRDATLRLEKTGLLGFFCCMVSYDMVKVKKPDPEPFLVALGMMNARADETVLVGDSLRRDIEPCHHLGIRTVYARYGDRFSRDRNFVSADFTIDSMGELQEILCGLRRENGEIQNSNLSFIRH